MLFDTLVKQVKENEILGILCHEIGHWHHSHIQQSLAIVLAYLGATFYAFSKLTTNRALYASYGFVEMPMIVGLLLFFQTFWAPVDKALQFVITLKTRSNEYEADRYSTRHGHAGSLQRGLIKITVENLSTLDPDEWYSTYHYTHPPLLQRVAEYDPSKPSAA